MKHLMLLHLLCSTAALCLAQGSTCSNAIQIPLDGNIVSFPTSASTGAAVVCTNYTATSPVTWFRFTTNASGQCPLLNIGASDNGSCEVALYTSCNGGQNLQAASSMCFDDGTGLWAPAETYVMNGNQTYYLRIKTATACNISIGGQSYQPANNSCNGAFSIGTSTINDNNSCHKPGAGVTPDQLCAFSIENTAFYQFYVATTGSAIINISNISCDNGAGNNQSGFQVGFFKGSCAALVPINCTSGSGNFVQATTDPLPAGTLVYVAIDGMAGSNCKYSISGVNVYGVLAGEGFKKFTVWKGPSSNKISWIANTEQGTRFVIERSADGTNFSTLASLSPSYWGEGKTFTYEDGQPAQRSYYRIRKQSNGQVALSPIVLAERKEAASIRITNLYPSGSQLVVRYESPQDESAPYFISSLTGQLMMKGTLNFSRGQNTLVLPLSQLPKGKYIITTGNKEMVSKSFVVY